MTPAGKSTTKKPRRSAKLDAITALLGDAGLETGVESLEPLGIGTAGLNARGPRDEDGTHDRVRLSDGTSVIYREYARTTRMFSAYQAKETAVFGCLRESGLPTPQVLASREGGVLVPDGGGEPLEEVFRPIKAGDRPALWSEVGAQLRRLHEVPVDRAPFLDEPAFRRPWMDFVQYLGRTLRKIRAAHPDLADAVNRLLALGPDIHAWLDERPRSICCGAAGYLPGMLLERAPHDWRCTTWLSLGYYVWIGDAARDVIRIAVSHREWTGAGLPASFYESYGSRPDRVATLLYSTASQIGRGSAYLRPDSRVNRKGRAGPPPHSAAVEALRDLSTTVDRLSTLLR